MFKTLQCAAALGMALVWAQPASADLVKTSSVSVSVTSSSTTFSFNSAGLNNNLTAGTPFTINDFIVAHVATVSNNDNSGVISASFTFTNPTSASSTDTGTIVGSFAGGSGNLKSINVTWAAPITVSFSNGQSLLISLANTNFSCPNPSCNSDSSFNIAGTFTLSGATAVPGPIVGAGLPGLLAGFGAMLAWRRKRRAAV